MAVAAGDGAATGCVSLGDEDGVGVDVIVGDASGDTLGEGDAVGEWMAEGLTVVVIGARWLATSEFGIAATAAVMEPSPTTREAPTPMAAAFRLEKRSHERRPKISAYRQVRPSKAKSRKTHPSEPDPETKTNSKNRAAKPPPMYVDGPQFRVNFIIPPQKSCIPYPTITVSNRNVRGGPLQSHCGLKRHGVSPHLARG
ncbi:hypothetical protein [Sinomonas albida]|uniref:hypothetical protein n=1 Tax=Sinomonas albida TaxID=369942 RepID=UPI00301A6AB6